MCLDKKLVVKSKGNTLGVSDIINKVDLIFEHNGDQAVRYGVERWNQQCPQKVNYCSAKEVLDLAGCIKMESLSLVLR